MMDETSSGKVYPLSEALKALQALREKAGMEPEMFPVQAFVGMISDEIEALRAKGVTDQQIAETIASHSRINISADEIAANYASPEERHPPQDGADSGHEAK